MLIIKIRQFHLEIVNIVNIGAARYLEPVLVFAKLSPSLFSLFHNFDVDHQIQLDRIKLKNND